MADDDWSVGTLLGRAIESAEYVLCWESFCLVVLLRLPHPIRYPGLDSCHIWYRSILSP